MNENIEIWADIDEYEGLYEVSTLGRVRSYDRWTKGKCGSMQLRKGRILKPILDKDGYQVVWLSKGRKKKVIKVHRLVAQAFIPNPQHLPQINHINEDKTDNCVNNLEWCDCRYNSNFGTRNERLAKAKTNGKLSKRVAQINPQTDEIIRIWPSTRECGRKDFKQGNVAACCRGKLKTHHGFKWRYID